MSARARRVVPSAVKSKVTSDGAKVIDMLEWLQARIAAKAEAMKARSGAES